MFINRFKLDGKIALLTGAGRGIGLGMAKVLAESGCAVAIQDIDLPTAEREAEQLRSQGRRAIALGGDIADLAAVESLVPATREQLGGIHILINNAGLQADKHFLEQGVDEIERQFRGNLTATLRLVQQVTPIFKEQKWGRIINIGSIQGRRGNANNVPYGMTKAAVMNLTTGIARELGRDAQCTVNCISPGWFDTYRNIEQLARNDTRRKASEWIPAGRLGDDLDCAGLALLLCSDAGSYITGQTIVVDGGLTL